MNFRLARHQSFAALLLVLSLSASLVATAPVPRKSSDFTIVEPLGREAKLSSFKGKVVVVEFLFLRSLRCARVAQTLNRLYTELGPRGFQPVGIVFGPAADPQSVNYLAESFKLTYPIGFATADKVDSFLAREPKEILNIPQIVVIDRAGMIRAQTGGKGGDRSLENEDSLRALITSLLKEEPPRAHTKQKPIARTSAVTVTPLKSL